MGYLKKTKNRDCGDFPSVLDDCLQNGLTKREYFASKAMAALIANPDINRPKPDGNIKNDMKEFCLVSTMYADGLLDALEE